MQEINKLIVQILVKYRMSAVIYGHAGVELSMVNLLMEEALIEPVGAVAEAFVMSARWKE